MHRQHIRTTKKILKACWSAGYFPSIFKRAIIELIPQKDKAQTNPMNYRPISLLEVPGKIFERIIQARLNTFSIGKQHIKSETTWF